MFDDFFTRALIAGIGVALIAGPLGCFIIWRRLAYFGDTLAHAALLGVAISFLADINLTVAVFLVGLLISAALILLQARSAISSDAILGLLSHSALAIGLVVLGLMTWLRVDLTGLLFGDILAVSKQDLAVIWGGGAVVLTLLAVIWRPLFASTISVEIAASEGQYPKRYNLIFTLLMALFISLALKIVGALLVTAMLIIPAAAARRLAMNPEQMAIVAALIGLLSVVGGLGLSMQFDTPSGPSIVVGAFLLFLVSLLPLSAVYKRVFSRKGVEK